jgi:hypothetical protein
MYSLGRRGVGQKFPDDEKNFRIFHGIRRHEGVCYPENKDEKIINIKAVFYKTDFWYKIKLLVIGQVLKTITYYLFYTKKT